MEDSKKMKKPNPFLVAIVILLILGAVIFLPAGTLRYWEGWLLWTSFSILTLFITVFFGKKSPELLSRRMHVKEKDSTRKPPAIFNLCFLCYVIPGLDFRFHWSAVPVWVIIAANVVVILGYLFIIRVFKENSYASTIVQVEEEQKVISTGPYGVVRHPMYLGLILMILFTPLALGSYWAVIPALLIIPLNVIRIKGEEEVLRRELPGYEAYCLKTRYRLIPYVW